MKTLKSIFALALVFTFSVAAVNAQTVNANAVITQTIAYANATAIDFGTTLATGSAQTVDASVNGSQGSIDIIATSGATIDVTVNGGAATYTLTRSSGTETMTVDIVAGDVTYDFAADGVDGTFASLSAEAITIPGSDSDNTVTLFLDSTLNVGASQVAGTYTGSVTVSAVYQ